MKKEEIIKLYQDYRLYIFPVMVALSSLALIVFIIYPQTVKLIVSQKAGGEFFNKSQILAAKAQALESIDGEDLTMKLQYAISSYPSDKDFVSVMALLQNITASSGFSIISMSLGGSSAQSYNIRLEVLGLNNQLPTLLGSIESSSRLMRVASIETSSGGTLGGATTSLSVDVLYSSTPAELGSVDAPLPQLSGEDEEVITELTAAVSEGGVSGGGISPQPGPRGKTNPFE